MNDSPILMIDARNVMYRAIFAGKNQDRRGPKRSYFVIWLRMMASWIRTYKPSKVQVFWDAPRKEIWRRQILATYKNRIEHTGDRDISDDLINTEQVAREMFGYLNVYQFNRKKQEADDLIYAACKYQQHKRMIIVSSDADMQQIPFSMPSVRIYNPDKSMEMPVPTVNPVFFKALIGDKSDLIDGYYGTGPVGAGKMLESHAALQEHLNKCGKSIFARNLALIDMSLNPFVLGNLLYIAKVLSTTPKFDRAKILELEKSLKINGLSMEYGEIVAPFKSISND